MIEGRGRGEGKGGISSDFSHAPLPRVNNKFLNRGCARRTSSGPSSLSRMNENEIFLRFL